GEALPELGLAHEKDLEELVGRGLEIREEPDLLERAVVQVLRLVDDENRVLTGATALDQESVERHQPLGPRLPGGRDAEVLQCVLEDPVDPEGRVEDEGDSRARVE